MSVFSQERTLRLKTFLPRRTQMNAKKSFLCFTSLRAERGNLPQAKVLSAGDCHAPLAMTGNYFSFLRSSRLNASKFLVVR
jgi:hypothetical protein